MADSDGVCGVCHLIDEEHFDRLQIQCDGCNTWYHANCVNLEEYEIDDIDHYHCDKCVPKLGSSKAKPVCNTHRHDYSEANANNKPLQSGTLQFVYELRRRKFPSSPNMMISMDNGYDLTSRFLELCSFDKPIFVKSSVGLGMNVPSSKMTLEEIERLIDPDYEVDVIDVQRQHSYKMKFGSYLRFFRQPKRKRIYNLISLEFSGTKMSNVINLPSIVEELSWVNQFWPKKFDNTVGVSANKELSVLNEHVNIKPEVSKFCLLSMSDSYTDFHIDFGGTSVWYHVLWGEKWFYLIEPTDSNLALYEEWSHASNKSERFLGDEVERCYLFVLKPGQTLFIPTGWIHAVLTPIDSLVFGGNFLHSFNISLQIRIYEMEVAAATHEKFMFPHFELLNWYAGLHFLDVLKDANEEKVAVKNYLSRGIRSLVVAMKRWIVRNQSAEWPLAKFSAATKRADKIDSMTCAQLLKKLEKALSLNEKYLAESKSQMLKAKRPSAKRRFDSKSNKTVSKSALPAVLPIIKTFVNTIGPMKSVVPGSFKNATKKTDKSVESDLTGCPKSPVKISLKPGAWNLTNATLSNPALLSPATVTPLCTLKLKLPRSETVVEESTPTVAEQPIEIKSFQKGSDEESGANIALPTSVGDPKPSMSTDSEVRQTVITLSSAESSQEMSDIPPQIVVAQAIRKKVGFSLLDLNKTPSSPPTASPTANPLSPASSNLSKSETTNNDRPSPGGASASSDKSGTVAHRHVAKPIGGLNVQKHKVKVGNKTKATARSSSKKASKLICSSSIVETGTHLTGIFGVSKHGRVQKMNQKAFGDAKSTEFLPELGHCRKDEEFVYPSLFDSDGEDGRLKKRSKQDDSGSAAFSHPGKFSLTTFNQSTTATATVAPKKKRRKGVQKPEPYQQTSAASATDFTSSEDSQVLTTAQSSSSNQASTAVVASGGQKKPTPAGTNKSVAGSKPKKKVTTAKQRLATKLKLHKMIPTL